MHSWVNMKPFLDTCVEPPVSSCKLVLQCVKCLLNIFTADCSHHTGSRNLMGVAHSNCYKLHPANGLCFQVIKLAKLAINPGRIAAKKNNSLLEQIGPRPSNNRARKQQSLTLM